MKKKNMQYLDIMALYWVLYRTGLIDSIFNAVSERDKLEKIKKILENKEDKKE